MELRPRGSSDDERLLLLLLLLLLQAHQANGLLRLAKELRFECEFAQFGAYELELCASFRVGSFSCSQLGV